MSTLKQPSATRHFDQRRSHPDLTDIFFKKYNFFMSPSAEIHCITERAHAAEVLQPLRLEILQLAREPASASEISQKHGLSRQRVNYHVRILARSGFLRRAGRRRRRNMIEQRYVASARAFLLSPELLAGVGADWRRVEDATSAGYLLALNSQMGSDLVRVWRDSGKAGKRASTLSLKSQFRFESPEQRERFARALREAVVRVVTEHTSPNLKPDGSPAPGRPYRLVLGCYPYLPQENARASAQG
jgi:DNA-binding transcriptional ArsR family regulator